MSNSREHQLSIHDLHSDNLSEIFSFLSLEDFCQVRLTCRCWEMAARNCHQSWATIFDQLITEKLPRSHLFQTVTIYSSHPLFRDHPLLWLNKRRQLYKSLNLSVETHTGWEIDRAILNRLRVQSEPQIHHWTSSLSLGDRYQRQSDVETSGTAADDDDDDDNEQRLHLLSGSDNGGASGSDSDQQQVSIGSIPDFDEYSIDVMNSGAFTTATTTSTTSMTTVSNSRYPTTDEQKTSVLHRRYPKAPPPPQPTYDDFCVLLNYVKQGESTRGSKQRLEHNMKLGIMWHNGITLLKLLFLVVFVLLMLLPFCIIGFMRTHPYGLYEKVSEHSWSIHLLFGILYAVWLAKFSLDLLHYAQHVFFWRAHIHTRVTTEKCIRNVIHTVVMLSMGLVSILLFHLRASGVMMFRGSATVCLTPIMLILVVEAKLYFIDWNCCYGDPMSMLDRLVPVMRTLVSLWTLIILEGLLILFGLRIDNLVSVNYSVLFIPFDILFLAVLLQLCVSTVACVSPKGRSELARNEISSYDIICLFTSFLLLAGIISIQVLLGMEAYSVSHYSFVSVAFMGTVWGMESGLTAMEELSFK